ncbi:hypothetical protein V2J09_016921 [Rumex salicifolius]
MSPYTSSSIVLRKEKPLPKQSKPPAVSIEPLHDVLRNSLVWRHRHGLKGQVLELWSAEDPKFLMLCSMIMSEFKIISWNIQGAGNKQFLHCLKDLIRMHDPTILVLLETRISGTQADKVCAQIGSDSLIRSEASGFSGGIWVLWRNDRVFVSEVDVQVQAVTLKVRRTGEHIWLFSAIYANPKPAMREYLWHHLLEVAADNDLPWLLLGDFNTANLEERTGNFDELRRRCARFSNWIEEMNLLDLGYSGQRYTWSRGRDPETRTNARLDRERCTADWHAQFSDASLRHLLRNQSDHVPLLVNYNGFEPDSIRNKTFRFQAAWLLNEEFNHFLAAHWEVGVSLTTTLANMTIHLDSWISRSLETCSANRRIEGVQCKLGLNCHNERALLQLECKLRRQLDIAWTDALMDRDRNTRYFHACTIIRRKHNKIEGLMNLAGEWCWDQADL